MEPLDPEMEYMVHPSSAPGSRFNTLLIFPVLGVLLIVLFSVAVIFQIDLSSFLDPLEGGLMLGFFLLIIGLFWAMAPMVRRNHH